MSSKQLLQNIRKDLLSKSEKSYKEGVTRFFKEKINSLGVRTPKVRKLAKFYYQDLKNIPKKELFELCEKLLEKKTVEETLIAFAWAKFREKELDKTDFSRFEKWLKNYANNWAFVDDFCTHAFGYIVTNNPSLIPKVKKWTKSKNRWLRRSSAVILIHAGMKKKKEYLPYMFEIADLLLLDQDDLVQKGYGWMLKVASKTWPGPIFQFVLQRKDQMPRTALRYAIEKYPKEMRKEAMA